MTTLSTSAQNIREHAVRTFDQFKAQSTKQEGLPVGSIELQMMSAVYEIAAQLAEQTEVMRQDRAMRQQILDEERGERKKRDELLANSAAGIDAFRKSMETPPPTPPRVIFPNEVTHLACLVREPDGTHILASDNGPVRLEPEEAQRILALMNSQQPNEAKPQ